MPLAQASALARAHQEAYRKGSLDSPRANFARPHRQGNEITDESEEEGCGISYTLHLDAQGRCDEIRYGGGC